MLNGAMNVAMDRPFFQNWQTAAVGGAIAGATAGLAAGPEAAAALFARGSTSVASAAGAGRVLIEAGKQGKHLLDHNNFRQGSSILTHSNPQALLNEFAGTGQRISGVVGGPGKERVNFGQVIGQINVNGVLTNTTNGIIHYSKNGAHIVPANP